MECMNGSARIAGMKRGAPLLVTFGSLISKSGLMSMVVIRLSSDSSESEDISSDAFPAKRGWLAPASTGMSPFLKVFAGDSKMRMGPQI